MENGNKTNPRQSPANPANHCHDAGLPPSMRNSRKSPADARAKLAESDLFNQIKPLQFDVA